MIPIRVSVGPLVTASANNIAHSQTPGSAGKLTLNGSTVTGGVAVLDTARNVLITTTADEAANTFTITGTNWAADIISEVMIGPNDTTGTSILDYKTVISIVISGGASGALTVGTTTTAGSPWARLDEWANSYVSIQCNVTGTINYTVQQTLDDPNDPTNPVLPANITWVNSSDASAVSATGSIQTNYGFVPIWARVLLNSGTGSVTASFVQSGVVSL